MDTQLKTCPFCDANVELIVRNLSKKEEVAVYLFAISCESCDEFFFEDSSYDPENCIKTIDKWNARAT